MAVQEDRVWVMGGISLLLAADNVTVQYFKYLFSFIVFSV